MDDATRLDPAAVRVKLRDNTPLTDMEARALYELMLSADSAFADGESVEAGYGRFVHRAYARCFVAD